MPTRIIMHSVCHVFYYVNGNWIGSFFSLLCLLCLYGNQEIRLTDVPAILMAASSHQSFLAILFLCRTSLSPFISLTHHSLPLLSFSPLLCLMCSLLGKEGNFHIESQPGSGDLDLTPSRCRTPTNENVFCACACVHVCIVQMWAAALPGENAAWLQCVLLVLVAVGQARGQQYNRGGNNRNIILFSFDLRALFGI